MASLVVDYDSHVARPVNNTSATCRNPLSVKKDDATDATETPSLPSPKSSIFTQVKEKELERAKAKGSRYQPSDITNSESLKKAMIEFDRRLEEESEEHPQILWVLVATYCDQIPKTLTVTNLLNSTGLSKSYSGLKFCLTEDNCLYIISFVDGQRRGMGVSVLLDAMSTFSKTVQNNRLFSAQTNVVAQVDGNNTAPDAALKKLFPMRPLDNISLRAPFIAEVHSKGKTVDGSLNFLSNYLRNEHSDYVMFIHAYDKNVATGLFAAVAILWRASAIGQRAPLAVGQMATLVSAQSFGTQPLCSAAIEALGRTYGHLPGVPAAMLALQEPQNVVVPRAQLLHNVRMANGATFVADNGADLVVELPVLNYHLQVSNL